MEKLEPIYLQAVKMENAQSHVKTIYEFAPNKINVLAANNGVGKSVFFKMLKATLLPRSLSEQDRFDLIRHGCEYAQITYLFSDGAWGLCRIYLKSIVYNYAAPGAERPLASYDVPEELINHLNVLMDVSSNFITNIIDTKQNLLLVDSNLKSNYQLLKLIACDDTLQDLLEKLPMKIEDAKKLNTKLSAKVDYIRQRFDSLSYVDEAELRYQIQSLESKTDVLYKAVDCYKLLGSIEMLLTDKLDFDKLFSTIRIFEHLHGAIVSCDKSVVHSTFDGDKLITVGVLEKLLRVSRQVNEHKFSYDEFDSVTLDKVALLAKLLKLLDTLAGIKEVSKSSVKKIDLLAKLCNLGIATANVTPVQFKDYKVITAKLNELLKVTRVVKSLDKYSTQMLSLAQSQERYLGILEKIKQSNCTMQCGIYGEVIFDGEHCTPIK